MKLFSFQEKCSIISSASVKSLQIYLEKFCTPVLAFNFCSEISWNEREVEVVAAAECKSSVLSWMKAVFYEITTGDVNCILMVCSALIKENCNKVCKFTFVFNMFSIGSKELSYNFSTSKVQSSESYEQSSFI